MNNEKLAMLLFDIGLVLTMISMVIGPFEITNWALTAGVIACFFGIASICIGFLNWDEWMNPEQKIPEPPQKREQPSEASAEQTAETFQQ